MDLGDTRYMIGQEMIGTIEQVEERYQAKLKETPGMTATKIIEVLQEVVRNDLLIAWLSQIHSKRNNES